MGKYQKVIKEFMLLSNVFMIIVLLIVGIFALTSFASEYKNYSKTYSIAYPDSMGFLGGAIFGFFS